jgi:SAM-dependent methyltransferase
MNLEPTGERMVLEHYKSSPEDFVIYLMHEATYRFAAAYTAGKRVLDYGCGSGYGSAFIADGAASVVGVDVADDAIRYARATFARANLDFRTIDPSAPLPFPDGSFDVVLSFQVFEHVTDTDHYLREVRRVLTPNGRLVLATPDRSTRLLPAQRPWNRWHVHEYDRRGLRDVLARHFNDVQVLGMGGTPEVIGIELRRCRRIKWLSLPFTLPFLPDRWRVHALNAVHRVRGAEARTGQARDYPFGVEDIRIAADARPSLNLVALAS